MPLQTNQVLLHRYELRRPLGHGSAATTFLAFDRLWNRRVALKIVHAPSFPLVQSLQREFSVLSHLSHPNVLHVLDFALLEPQPGSAGHRCLFASAYIDGRVLSGIAPSLSPDAFRAVVVDIVLGLRAIHTAGYRHGDVKPANILVRPDHRAVLIDLGMVRPLRAPASGDIQGTPAYLAPELVEIGAADARADLYSLGVTIQRVAPSLPSPLPDDLRALAERLSSPAPDNRPVSADEVLDTLAVPSSRRSGVASLAASAFVGRARAMTRATELLDAMLSGKPGPRAVVVRGDRGAGKSRFVREVKWAAQQRCRVIESSGERAGCVTDALAWLGGVQSGPQHAGEVVAWQRSVMATLEKPAVLIVDDVHALDDRQRGILQVFLAGIRDDGPIFVLCSATPEVRLAGTVELFMEPLTEHEIGAWLPDISQQARHRLLRFSGGLPAAVRWILDRIDDPGTIDQTLAGWEARGWGAGGDVDVSVPKQLRPILAKWLVWSGPVPCEASFRDSCERLAHLGILREKGTGWVLSHVVSRRRLIEQVGQEALREAHEWALSKLKTMTAKSDLEPRAELLARKIHHLVALGHVDEACDVLLDAEQTELDKAPMVWVSAVVELADITDNESVQLQVARLERRAGRGADAERRARSWLERGAGRHAWSYELAEALRVQGKLSDALAVIDAVAGTGELTWRLQLGKSRARCLLKMGDYRSAAHQAAQCLDKHPAEVTRGDLLETLGLAESYQGQTDEAMGHLAAAEQIGEKTGDPRRAVRASGARGLAAFLAGDVREAAHHYHRALHGAQEHGLADQIATAALNVGTASHQQGLYAEALSAYQRGEQIARALGQRGSLVNLSFNLAKLYLDLGQFDRAAEAIDRCDTQRRPGDSLEAACLALRGELALLRAQPEEAKHLLAQSLRQQQSSSPRDIVETRCLLVDALLRTSDESGAAEQLQEAKHLGASLDAVDIAAQIALAEAAIALANNPNVFKPASLEALLDPLASAHLGELEARVQASLASGISALGSRLLAKKYAETAAVWWEKVSLSLPPPERESFWRHPVRSGVRSLQHQSPRSTSEDAPAKVEHRLRRALQLVRHINATTKTREVLNRLMDAATELTGAERGFLLLAPTTGTRQRRVKVHVARNFDHHNVDSARFSRSIAEHTISEGEPLLLADAQLDERFSQERSVHTMNLRSVLCVPIRTGGKTLGALYLDNRFSRGQFQPDDLDLALVLADHAALALAHAKLMGELRDKTRQLERQREQIERLAQGQAEQIEELQTQVRQVVSTERNQRYAYRGLIGSAPSMKRVLDVLDRVIDTDLTVLIQGETGTGKEVIARAIHTYSPRQDGPWTAINCGALPENLLEAELFGFERGAFTGADRPRRGLMVRASGGTLFLDEIGEVSQAVQVKLLRALQEREVLPLGASRPVPVDFRLVCATNRELEQLVEDGTFREDLFYRLSVVRVTLPPLRDRADDIPLLVKHLLAKNAKQIGEREPAQLTAGAMKKLLGHPWPGNVRELENCLLRAAAMSTTGKIRVTDLGLTSQQAHRRAIAATRQGFQQQERERIVEALERNRWNVARTARELGIPRSSLYRKMNQLGKLPSQRD